MREKILNLGQIKQAIQYMRAVNQDIEKQKKLHPISQELKASALPIPSKFSESVAIYLLQKQQIVPKLRGYSFARSGSISDPDIIAISPDTTQRLTIEIKASGSTGFNRLSEHDIKANYLIWFAFDKYCHDSNQDMFVVYSVPNPRQYFSKSGYMSLTNFLKIVKSGLTTTQISLS